MRETIPYSDLVGQDDPLQLLTSTPGCIAALVGGWDIRRWAATYALGKWTGAQIVLHLAQDEIGWCNRIRLALSVEPYAVQAYDGDRWVELETPALPEVALDAYLALRRLNLLLYRKLSMDQRARPIPHPEYGPISIEWILRVLAGHDLHHLRHLQLIAAI
jgi:hypothetical protein